MKLAGNNAAELTAVSCVTFLVNKLGDLLSRNAGKLTGTSRFDTVVNR